MATSMWSWGANTTGQLGHGFASEQVSRPTIVQSPKIVSLLNSYSSKSTVQDSIKVDGGGNQVIVCICKIEDGKSEETPDRENTISNECASTSNNKSILISIGVTNNATSNFNNSSSVSKPLNENLYEPIVIREDLNILEIACGWDFNLVLTHQFEVYSWGGDNKYGQLGRTRNCQQQIMSSIKPAKPPSDQDMEKIPNFLARKISAGLRHAAAIGIDGHLYVWGDNSKSLLGVKSSDKICWQPTRASLNYEDGDNGELKFIDVQCGKSFTIALDYKGQFWGCGCNKFGQLLANPSCYKAATKFIKLPISLSLLSQSVNVNIKQFKCAWSHVLVLLDDGKLFAWGRNNFCQLGNSSKQNESESRDTRDYVEIKNIPDKVINIACGSEHNLALGISGRVYSWGWNEHENCGVESSKINIDSSKTKLNSSEHKEEEHCDFVSSPTLVLFNQPYNCDNNDVAVIIACGAGNGLAVCSSLQT